MRNLAGLALISALAFGGAVSADEDKNAAVMQTLTKFGLRGVWSPDCYRAASSENPRMTVDFSVPGARVITTRRRANASSADRLEEIETATLTPPDMLVMHLLSVTADPDVSYERTDTYQRIGARMQLRRSEVTASSAKAQASGYLPGVLVDGGTRTRLGGYEFTLSPILEQCQE